MRGIARTKTANNKHGADKANNLFVLNLFHVFFLLQ